MGSKAAGDEPVIAGAELKVEVHVSKPAITTQQPGRETRPSPRVATRARRHRPSVNLTGTERVGRVLLGIAAATVGIALLISAGSLLAAILLTLLVLAGLDLLITGALGHCPLYQKLGYVPASLRRSP